MTDPDETISEDIRRQATEWHTLMNSGLADREMRSAFEAWLHADRRHKKAYFEEEQTWRDLDFVFPAAGIEISGGSPPAPIASWQTRLWRWIRRPLPALGSAATAMAALVFVMMLIPQTEAPEQLPPEAPDYATQIAELEEVTLDDGSVITLGARSQMDVEFTSDTRLVRLIEGEAFFDVATDETRPFLVSVDDTLVRVVGTQFDVKRMRDDVHVSVLEGTVKVMTGVIDLDRTIDTDPGSHPAKILTAGQKIVSEAGVLPDLVRKIEVATPGAWRSGRLAYEDASLDEIIADVNRYSLRRIRIADRDLGELRFTMGFQTDQIDAWLDVVEASQPINVIDPGYGDIVLEAR